MSLCGILLSRVKGIEPSEIAIVDAEDPEKTYDKIEANKYGYAEGVVKVQITVSAQLEGSLSCSYCKC